jgi:hypothetical protein
VGDAGTLAGDLLPLLPRVIRAIKEGAPLPGVPRGPRAL